MEADTTSTNTSVDDRTEGENPTRDLLADGIVNMLKPTVDQIEERIKFTRIRQVELHQHIETLLIDLQRISEAQPAPLDFEEYVKKLTNTKRRVMVINNILHNAQERLNRIHQSIIKETNKRKAFLEPSPLPSPAAPPPSFPPSSG